MLVAAFFLFILKIWKFSMNCTTQRVTLERGNNFTEDLKLFEIYLGKKID